MEFMLNEKKKKENGYFQSKKSKSRKEGNLIDSKRLFIFLQKGTKLILFNDIVTFALKSRQRERIKKDSSYFIFEFSYKIC